MARNEEKQQGRLNRLWLQKEREGKSIKSEIEYYLQQSQLIHYPERKIAEFQFCIKELEHEYKRFVVKLRALDPTCKHKPWTPRAYSRKRADIKNGSNKSLSKEGEDHMSLPEAKLNPIAESSEPVCVDQDLPLSFNRTRLAVAVAGFRGPVTQSGASHTTHNLTQALHAGLPNLSGSLLGQTRRRCKPLSSGKHHCMPCTLPSLWLGLTLIS
uniref:Si:dkey-86e18.1 n=1 Tax=Gadus morhua TaxID=8049 RepID=A0A8C4ZXS1_GADMO